MLLLLCCSHVMSTFELANRLDGFLYHLSTAVCSDVYGGLRPYGWL